MLQTLLKLDREIGNQYEVSWKGNNLSNFQQWEYFEKGSTRTGDDMNNSQEEQKQAVYKTWCSINLSQLLPKWKGGVGLCEHNKLIKKEI